MATTAALQISHLDVLPETKCCYDCGLTKPIDEFAFHHKARGTRQGRCRRCHAIYRRAHYRRNRDTYIRQEVARIKRYREENRPKIREYLRAHPCVDCGETNIVVLDFDHRDPKAKAHNVVVLAMHKPWTRVLAEIAKCAVPTAIDVEPLGSSAGARWKIFDSRSLGSRRSRLRHDDF